VRMAEMDPVLRRDHEGAVIIRELELDTFGSR